MSVSSRVRDRERIEAMVGRVTLEAFLRNQPSDEHPVCLTAATFTRLLHRVEELARFAMPRRVDHVLFATEVDPDLVFLAHRPSLFRGLMILVENAFDALALSRAGRVVVSAKAVFGEVCITVADSGRGLPEDWQDALRSRAELPGVSGLAEASSLAHRMGGALRLVSSGRAGTSMAFDLPDGSMGRA
ncbi:MAG: ATP-binding protein [Pseudomonadota bacterium]